MQPCIDDVTINEIPKFLAYILINETHSIFVTDPIDPAQRLISTLAIIGVTVYFPTRTITKYEWESGSYSRLELTNDFFEMGSEQNNLRGPGKCYG